jgi:hypothetical protein
MLRPEVFCRCRSVENGNDVRRYWSSFKQTRRRLFKRAEETGFTARRTRSSRETPSEVEVFVRRKP